MTWEQFVEEYARMYNLPKAEARKRLAGVFKFLAAKARVHSHVPVPGFGKFKRVHKKARKVKVPEMGQQGEAQVKFVEHDLPEGYKVAFLPAPDLKHIGV